MYEGGVQSVLRCEQCNKPFDKESTLKRHGYYCRSRRAGSSSRSRSCISCVRGKARCDNRRPKCSRCIKKAVECHYPANTAKNSEPKLQPNDDAPTKRRKVAPSLMTGSANVDNRQDPSNNDEIALDSALAIPDQGFADFGEQYLQWEGPDIDFDAFLKTQTVVETAQYPLDLPSGVRHSTLSAGPTSQAVQVQEAMSSPSVTTRTPSNYALRSLLQRPRMTTGAQRIANLILHNLKSYPIMMMRYDTLPPYIHPRLISSDVENNFMEPMANCISLVHMISSGIQGSRKLFWKNVRLECEQLCEEHLKLNKWAQLAALQALSIYILIRLDEGETDHNNLDFLLLKTVTMISKQISDSETTCNRQCARCNHGLDICWTEWIFEESKRRLCMVYQVMNLLIYFEPAAMCDRPTDLILGPLPANKRLWEAGDELTWKAEHGTKSRSQTELGLAANGELIELDESQLHCGDAMRLHESSNVGIQSNGIANWEEWTSGMDALGGLVMLAASLVVC